MTARDPGSRWSRWLALAAALAIAALAAVGWARGWRLGLHRTAAMGAPVRALDFEEAAGGRLGREGSPAGAVRNLILIVGDGMGFSHLAAARAEIAGVNGRLFLERLPVAGWVTSHAIDELRTDSASAATALASGEKTHRGMVGRTPDGRSPRTLLEAALERGMAAGLVTSSVIVDATPAAFVAHVESRDLVQEICAQMAASGIELMISEGPGGSTSASRRLTASALDPFERAGYRVFRDWSRLRREAPPPGDRLLVVLEAGAIAQRRDPSLGELAGFALERLAESADGFFLLVEEEETDSGGHANDLSRVVEGIRDLDGVARRAVEFARRAGDTLVVITSDHETGGLVLVDGAAGGRLSYYWSSRDHTAAPVPLLAYGPGAERLAGVLDISEIPGILAELMGLELAPGRIAEGAAGEREGTAAAEGAGASPGAGPPGGGG